ncbi:MAG: two-component hybrid sensor and regulator [Panacagrimonas sp.]|nr:ATP-binding protein [Panacagrimonas sp.]MCC2656960.1 two-component hybrid sensor and regulator [Panacagrimonas sp.]
MDDRPLIEAAFEPYLELEADGRVTAISDRAAKLLRLGGNPQAAGTRSIAEGFVESDRSALLAWLGTVQGLKPAVACFDALSDDGTSFAVQLSATRGERLHVFVHDLRRVDELVRNRGLLASIVDSSDDAIISKSLDGIITSWNAGAERLFEYTADEAVGRSVHLIIPPERAREEDLILQRLRRGQKVDHFETIRRSKSGREREISLTISPIRDEAGRIVGASKIARDVTERRVAERQAREEALRLELLNESGKSLAATLEVQQLLQIVTDVTTQLAKAQFGAFFYNTQDEQGDAYRLYSLSGAPRSAFEGFGHPRATPIFKPTFNGEDTVRFDDVTQDPRYGQMAPHFGMPAGHPPVRSYLAVPVIDRDRHVIGGLFFGHAKAAIFDERAARLVEGVAAQAAVALDNARLYESAQRSMLEREQLLVSERAARAEAERHSALKDEFLATLSHELRTPLSAILGWAEVLRRSPVRGQTLEKGLETIERNARMQTQLIEDLLDMSRITSGKVRLDIQQVIPIRVIESALESVRPAAESKGLRLETALDPVAGPVSGDPGRLQQVIWNLLSNAIKFTPRGGKIHVVLERVNSHVEISVSDTGQGIEPAFLPHVFERFRQSDSSTTRQHGGLGLGLSIVRQLVELHGGQVRAKSPGAGQGATFSVELPVAAVQIQKSSAQPRQHPREPAMPDDVSYAGLVGLDGARILVVDDERDARDLMRHVLSEAGAEVETAESAEAGLQKLKSMRPDVLISDIGMPDADGYEFLRQVRLDPQHNAIPAIALTAFARTVDRTRALRAGFSVHVAKPVDPAELVATIASVLGRWKV